MPAHSQVSSRQGMPARAARIRLVACTEWQSPTTGTRLVRAAARHIMLIGFV